MILPILKRLVYKTKKRFLVKICTIFFILILLVLFFLDTNVLNFTLLVSFTPKNDIQMSNFNQIQEENVFNKHDTIKVVFYEVKKVGYGNKLYSMLTSFMVAVVTESALLIDWPTIDKYIEEPFNLAFHKFNDKSPLDRSYQSIPIYSINSATINSWNYTKTILTNTNSIQIPENYTRYYVSDMIAYFFDLCHKRAYAEKLVRYGYVQEKTVRQAFELLEDKSARESQKIENLNLIGFEFAGNVLNKHWKPKYFLYKKMTNFLNKHFQNSFIIGKKIKNDL